MYFALPKEYREATADDLRDRIQAARLRLGKKLCILVHHYQRVDRARRNSERVRMQ